MEELRKSLGVSSLDNTFDNFKRVVGTHEAYKAFFRLANGESDYKMVLCYGGVGNGKTHLCEATAIRLYQRGLFCRVLTFDRMMGALKECIGDERKKSLEELLRNYSYADRLIIDDVAGTEWELEQLEKIIRIRYHDRLFTILTTNRDLTGMPVRIISRFQDSDVGIVVLNEGKDYRRLKNEQNKD